MSAAASTTTLAINAGWFELGFLPKIGNVASKSISFGTGCTPNSLTNYSDPAIVNNCWQNRSLAFFFNIAGRGRIVNRSVKLKEKSVFVNDVNRLEL